MLQDVFAPHLASGRRPSEARQLSGEIGGAVGGILGTTGGGALGGVIGTTLGPVGEALGGSLGGAVGGIIGGRLGNSLGHKAVDLFDASSTSMQRALQTRRRASAQPMHAIASTRLSSATASRR